MKFNPKELLMLANKVEPDKGWDINSSGRVVCRRPSLAREWLQPYDPIENLTQLMLVVFWLSDKADPMLLGTACDCPENILGLAIEFVTGRAK